MFPLYPAVKIKAVGVVVFAEVKRVTRAQKWSTARFRAFFFFYHLEKHSEDRLCSVRLHTLFKVLSHYDAVNTFLLDLLTC